MMQNYSQIFDEGLSMIGAENVYQCYLFENCLPQLSYHKLPAVEHFLGLQPELVYFHQLIKASKRVGV